MKVNKETIEKFRQILAKDPGSRVFAALAEAYREMRMLHEAEDVARQGIGRHPDYVGGYVSLARILIDQEEYQKAVPLLKKATELDSQNILAYQLLGNTYVQLKSPKEALKSFKMVLFLNPQSEKATQAIEKLESLTADEYADDVFTMKPLGQSKSTSNTVDIPVSEHFADPTPVVDLERSLSLVDALIVRNDLLGARDLLLDLQKRHPEDTRFASRWNLLQTPSPEEEATPIKPIGSRENSILQKKISLLERLLRRIKSVDQD